MSNMLELKNLTIESEAEKVKCPVNGTVVRRTGSRYTDCLDGTPKLVHFNREQSGVDLLDHIQVTSIEDDEVRTFTHLNRDPSKMEFVGVTQIVSPSLVMVVGARCPRPVLARIHPHYQPKLHDLLAARVRKISPQLKVVLTEQRDFITAVDDDKPNEFNCLTSEKCYFVGLRTLQEDDKTAIYNPGTLDNLPKKSGKYIRDVYVTLERMNEDVQIEKAQQFIVEKFLTLPTLTDILKKKFKISICLNKEEADRCLSSKGDTPWKTGGGEVMITHSTLKTSTQQHGIAVDVVKIEVSPLEARVHLHVSPYSIGLLNLINRSNVDFGDEPFKIGPNIYNHCSIADAIYQNFDNFVFNSTLLNLWAGKAPSCPDDEAPKEVSNEPFDVKGRSLDDFQLRAFRSALATTGFTAIEAPPGSGKTLLFSGMIKASHDFTPFIRFAVSSTTNVSIANAIETSYENYPELKVCREYSLHYARRHKMSKVALLLSLRGMAEKPLGHVSANPTISDAVRARRRAVRQLKKETNLGRGLLIIEARRQADVKTRNAFLEAYQPLAMGATTSLMTRSVRRGITRLIIDEAAMISPSHALALYCCIPSLRYVTLLGDSNQLKPYCLLNENSFSYSLLTRGELTRLNDLSTTNKQRLNTVYRCHPSIVDHILRPLYESDLRAGVTAQQRNLAEELDLVRAKDGSPFLFVNLEESDGSLRYNKEEIKVALTLLKYLIGSKGVRAEDIALICHHRAQQNRLKSALCNDKINIDVQTIDSFQAKVVLVLTTKTAHSLKTARQTLSFVSDVHRETVAVSRAQHMMYLLGDWEGLMETEFWGKYRNVIREAGALTNSYFRYIDDGFGMPSSSASDLDESDY